MKAVDFKLLTKLAQEEKDFSIASVIATLAMDDIPMTDAVIQLGIVLGVLLPGYYNGWSQEEG